MTAKFWSPPMYRIYQSINAVCEFHKEGFKHMYVLEFFLLLPFIFGRRIWGCGLNFDQAWILIVRNKHITLNPSVCLIFAFKIHPKSLSKKFTKKRRSLSLQRFLTYIQNSTLLFFSRLPYFFTTTTFLCKYFFFWIRFSFLDRNFGRLINV